MISTRDTYLNAIAAPIHEFATITECPGWTKDPGKVIFSSW